MRQNHCLSLMRGRYTTAVSVCTLLYSTLTEPMYDEVVSGGEINDAHLGYEPKYLFVVAIVRPLHDSWVCVHYSRVRQQDRCMTVWYHEKKD